MPSDVVNENGGEILDWDESLLLSPNQEHWFTTTSASLPAANSDVTYPSSSSNFHPQHFFHDTSAGDLSNPVATTNPSDDVFINQPHQLFEFDTHNGQHWSDLPSQNHANPPAGTVSISGGEERTVGLGLVESPLDSIGAVGEVLSQPSGDKRGQQDFTISRALLSPSRSVVSSISQDPAKPQREIRLFREGVPSSSKSAKSSMTTVSGYNSPNPNQGQIDRRKLSSTLTGTKGSPLNRMFSKNPLETPDDEDPRRLPSGIYTRGDSVVSSASGQSRNDHSFHKSDIADDDFASNTSRRLENRGAGNTPGVLRTRPAGDLQNGQHKLPHAKAFSIQIGSEVFKLSGASIMSDGQHAL